jgi:hypothetical protein
MLEHVTRVDEIERKGVMKIMSYNVAAQSKMEYPLPPRCPKDVPETMLQRRRSLCPRP